MPIGSRHVETGWIDLEDGWPVLRLDGGGRWRLDGPSRLWRLRGRRVVVEGVRDDFDLLAVRAITPSGEERRVVLDTASALGWSALIALALVLAAGMLA